MKIRVATKTDIAALVQLENDSFDTDQLDARRFRYFLNLSSGKLLVLEDKNELAGYGLLLFHSGTALARLYSIAIAKSHKGKGLGKKLLAKLEDEARNMHCSYLRLEVKESNKNAISLYEGAGFQLFNRKKNYYQDLQDALCFEKKIRNLNGRLIKGPSVPFIKQSTDFTCGPACLLMSMKALNPKIKATQEQEIQIWREATTVFMTSGHGGCGPHGLALAAHHRGFEVEIYLNTSAPLFIEGVRSNHKKEIIKLVQHTFEKEIKKENIKVYYNEYNWDTITEIFKAGGIPVILISAYRLTQNKAPHWIVLTGIESEFIYFHDPELGEEDNRISNMNIPVRKDEFESISKFGSRQLKSIVALYPK